MGSSPIAGKVNMADLKSIECLWEFYSYNYIVFIHTSHRFESPCMLLKVGDWTVIRLKPI